MENGCEVKHSAILKGAVNKELEDAALFLNGPELILWL